MWNISPFGLLDGRILLTLRGIYISGTFKVTPSSPQRPDGGFQNESWSVGSSSRRKINHWKWASVVRGKPFTHLTHWSLHSTHFQCLFIKFNSRYCNFTQSRAAMSWNPRERMHLHGTDLQEMRTAAILFQKYVNTCVFLSKAEWSERDYLGRTVFFKQRQLLHGRHANFK